MWEEQERKLFQQQTSPTKATQGETIMCFKAIGAHKKMCPNAFTVATVNGADIHGAIRESIHLAGNLTSSERMAEVTFSFLGVLVTVTEESVTDDIYRAWKRAFYSSATGRKVVGPYPAEEEISSAQPSQAQPIPA